MAAKQKEAKAASFLDDILTGPRTPRRTWADELSEEGQKALREIVEARIAGTIPWGYMSIIYRKFVNNFGATINVCGFREYINEEARKASAKQEAKKTASKAAKR